MIKIYVTLNVLYIYKDKKVRQKSGLVEGAYAIFMLTCHNIF